MAAESAELLEFRRGRAVLTISSGRPARIAAAPSALVATVTRPAPVRSAASPASRAAPGIACPPTMTTRPWSPLCAERSRGCSARAVTPASMRRITGLWPSRMSFRHVEPGELQRAHVVRRLAEKVTALQRDERERARRADREARGSPLSAWSPEGMSSASTGRPQSVELSDAVPNRFLEPAIDAGAEQRVDGRSHAVEQPAPSGARAPARGGEIGMRTRRVAAQSVAGPPPR